MGLKISSGTTTQADGGITEAAQLPVAAKTRDPAQESARNTVEPFRGPQPSPASPTADAGPTVSAAVLRNQVELCKRAAELGPLGQLGVTHNWLRTANKEVGMGQNPGQLPGHGEAPPVGLATQWINHAAEKEKECVVVPDVDAACVERETEFGKSTGTWIPLINDCHTRTQEVLDTCSTKPKPQSGPDFGNPTLTGAGYSL